MYGKSAIVSFCKLTLQFWELCTDLTKEMYKNIYCTVFLVQLQIREDGKEPVDKYYIARNLKSEDANMNDSKPLSFKTIDLRYISRNVSICCDMPC
jgi:hypothetical protein